MFNLFAKDEEEYNYFNAFETIALQLDEATDRIHTSLDKVPFDVSEETLAEVEKIKKAADQQKKKLLTYLYEDFLPPIERKDLIELTHALNAVLKNTTDLLIHLDMYQIKIIQPEMKQLMDLIRQATHKLPNLMKELEDFKHPQKIWEILEELDEMNTQSAQLYYQRVKNLSLGEMNSFNTMKHTRMYESFKEVFQAIEGLMNTVEAVIIENT